MTRTDVVFISVLVFAFGLALFFGIRAEIDSSSQRADCYDQGLVPVKVEGEHLRCVDPADLEVP